MGCLVWSGVGSGLPAPLSSWPLRVPSTSSCSWCGTVIYGSYWVLGSESTFWLELEAICLSLESKRGSSLLLTTRD